jgi:hypothetical protein
MNDAPPRETLVVAAVRLRLWAEGAGFRPVPVFSFDHGEREERGKRPLTKAWTDLARQNPPACLHYAPVAWAMNTGILCDGLRPWDVDIDDAALALQCCSLVLARFGEAPQRIRCNSPRRLLLYSAAAGAPRKLTLAGAKGKIEVLGLGNQFVAVF